MGLATDLSLASLTGGVGVVPGLWVQFLAFPDTGMNVLQLTSVRLPPSFDKTKNPSNPINHIYGTTIVNPWGS
jgi:hypothetical protein